MRIQYETIGQYAKRVREWHKWFAWYPVRVADGEMRWLEWVERSGNFWASYDGTGTSWTYRKLDVERPK